MLIRRDREGVTLIIFFWNESEWNYFLKNELVKSKTPPSLSLSLSHLLQIDHISIIYLNLSLHAQPTSIIFFFLTFSSSTMILPFLFPSYTKTCHFYTLTHHPRLSLSLFVHRSHVLFKSPTTSHIAIVYPSLTLHSTNHDHILLPNFIINCHDLSILFPTFIQNSIISTHLEIILHTLTNFHLHDSSEYPLGSKPLQPLPFITQDHLVHPLTITTPPLIHKAINSCKDHKASKSASHQCLQ